MFMAKGRCFACSRLYREYGVSSSSLPGFVRERLAVRQNGARHPVLNRRQFLRGYALAVGSLLKVPKQWPRTEAAPSNGPAPLFKTRGVVLVPEDLSWADWPACAQRAGLTTIGLHGSSPEAVVRFVRSDPGQAFVRDCRQRHLLVEYELHAMRELLPRHLFAQNPELFRADEQGQRTPDANLCVHAPRALEVAAENAVQMAEALRPDTKRFFFWGDDGMPWCRWRECRALSDSD
jgi:hypothetical protein